MQKLNLVITKSYSALYKAENIQFIDSVAGGLPSGYPQEKSLDQPKGLGHFDWQNLLPASEGASYLSLILGAPFTSCLPLILPPIKKQRLRQVAQFELENHLILPVRSTYGIFRVFWIVKKNIRIYWFII